MRMDGKERYEFIIKEDSEKKLVFLGSKGDPSEMNWVEGSRKWGTVNCPDTLKVEVKRSLLKNGRLQECYRFTNVTKFPVFLKKADIGIYTTFNDNYESAAECLERRCHTHIFCGKEISYVQAFRMGGRPPHLGLQLLKGSIDDYSVERDEDKRSDDRGDFILHPVFPMIEAGETVEIVWELFWFENQKDFERKLLEKEDFLYVHAKNFTFLPGEEMVFEVDVCKDIEEEDICIECERQRASCQLQKSEKDTTIKVLSDRQNEGEYKFNICIGGKSTYAILYRCSNIDEITRRRCQFIVKKQQYLNTGSHLNGAYLIYDKEEDNVYYSHLDDHNGGRERVGMGALLALYLQEHEDEAVYESLLKYREYVYRELYDTDSGVVYNDICRNNDWNRLYNYPWMAVLQIELYKLTGEQNYLLDAFRVMQEYYRQGGHEFYAIGIPMTELLARLEKEGLVQERELLRNQFLEHANVILRNGIHYPASEVAYEQSIVAPAVSILLQAEQITNNGIYLEEARRQIAIMDLFHGKQPDYHQFANAIRHWDGYWFGKKRTYGDTYPHYWSVLSGVAYAQMYEATGDVFFGQKAAASFRGCLNLFMKDGFASCAMVFPKQVNGKSAGFYDPWANDQDWALYYALKYKEIVEKRDLI